MSYMLASSGSEARIDVGQFADADKSVVFGTLSGDGEPYDAPDDSHGT